MQTMPSSSLVRNLDAQLRKLPTGTVPETLVLMDSHAAMERRLVELGLADQALILRYDSESACLSRQSLEAVQYACESLGVRTVLVLGHTLTISAAVQGFVTESILYRAAGMHKLIQEQKQCIVRHVTQLGEQLQGCCELSGSSVTVHGVFFLHESDQFLVYESEANEFVPIRQQFLIC